MDKVSDNVGEISGMPVEDIRDNSVTIILRANGKIFASGAEIGTVNAHTPDEDLDSVLRAVRGMSLNLQRTIATELGGRDAAYPLPKADVEEDDGPALAMMLADEDIKAGDPVVIDVEKGRARKPTDEEVTRKKRK